MIKYKAVFWYSPEIRAYEVTKQTSSTITFNDHDHSRREKLWSRDHKWFDDFDSAKTFLIDKYAKKAELANRLLEIAQSLRSQS